MNAPLITLVTGTYNRRDSLQRMVASYRASIPLGVYADMVIVDGGSNDGSIEWLRAQADVWLIEHGELLGAIKAFCDGANMATGKYVLIANDDIEFTDPRSIMRALTHLEDNETCGAVAFADNRFQTYKKPGYDVDRMWGKVYAQVGLFRRWLGNACHWWGYGEINSKTYGGDNLLSARIWEAGYSVDMIDGVLVHDYYTTARDRLRDINVAFNDRGFHELYPHGFKISPAPTIKQEDRKRLRILYLPIYENHKIQHEQKRGLRDALSQVGIIWEIDYMNISNPIGAVHNAVTDLKPHIVVSQFHGVDAITLPIARTIRQYHPACIMVNWNGDVWEHGLIGEKMRDFLRYFDLQLTVNHNVLATYSEWGVPAAYWQIGYEEPGDDLPDAPAYDIVFMGNNNHVHTNREMMINAVYDDYTVGIYGDGWGERGNGNCLYNFAYGKALYRNARISLGDNGMQDREGFVSNRFFQQLAAGNSLVIHQHIPGIEKLTGITPGKHFVEWHTVNDLRKKVAYYLDPANDKERKRIARAGNKFTLENHSFENRVKELFTLIETVAHRHAEPFVKIRHAHNGNGNFAVRGAVTGTSYQHDPTIGFIEVDSRDAEHLINTGKWVTV